MSTKKTEEIIASYGPLCEEIYRKVSELFLNISDNISETVKWSNPTWVAGKTNLAFIYKPTDADCLNLGFFKGTSLSDDKGLLKGTGKEMRHVKICSMEEVPSPQIEGWVREALSL